MIPTVKLVRVMIGIGVLIFIVANYSRIKRIPDYRVFTTSYGTILGGWVLSVLEELVWPEPLNLGAHILYTSSSILLAVWAWRIFGRKEDHQHESAGTD